MSLKKIGLAVGPYLLITICIVIAYLPTFSGEFLFDDHLLIERDSYIKTLHSPLSYLFQEDGVTSECEFEGYHTGYYRPLLNFSYSIDHVLWGSNAPGFRTTNVFLHILNCFVLFYLLQFLIKDRYVALWVTLIFALHPVNTESVSWIISRNNILATLFSLSSLLFYIKGWEGGNRLNWMASVLAFALAILSKELGIMVLPVFFLYKRLVSPKRGNVRKELLSYLPFIIVLAAYFLLRKAVISSFSSPLQMGDLWQTVCFAPYIILWNLRLIFLPYGLHSFVVNYPSTYLSWEFFSGLCYIGFLGLFLWKQRKNSIVIFSVLSFHVALLPTLHIIPTSATTLVSMRWIYFPMAFLSLAAAQSIRGLLKSNRFITTGVLCGILIYLGGYSYILNSYFWNSEDNLIRQEVLNFRNYHYAGGLARNLFHKRKYREAEKYFKIAMERYPQKAMNYLNYSAMLIETGRTEAAMACLEEARNISTNPVGIGLWLNNMGVVHFNLGNHGESVKYFLKAITICPKKIEYQVNLGAAYLAKGDYNEALAVLKEALELAPHSVPLRKNLAIAYVNMGKEGDAVRVLQGIPQGERDKPGIGDLIKRAETGMVKVKPETDRTSTTKNP